MSLGIHKIVEYWGCPFEILDDQEAIQTMFEDALRLSNATVIQIVFHKFSPQGVTGVAAIAESHVSIHTWPELGYAAVDIFTCGSKMKVNILLDHFEVVMQPETVEIQTLERGVRPALRRISKPSA